MQFSAGGPPSAAPFGAQGHTYGSAGPASGGPPASAPIGSQWQFSGAPSSAAPYGSAWVPSAAAPQGLRWPYSSSATAAAPLGSGGLPSGPSAAETMDTYSEGCEAWTWSALRQRASAAPSAAQPKYPIPPELTIRYSALRSRADPPPAAPPAPENFTTPEERLAASRFPSWGSPQSDVVRHLQFAGATPTVGAAGHLTAEQWDACIPQHTLWQLTPKALERLGMNEREGKHLMERLNASWHGCGILTRLVESRDLCHAGSWSKPWLGLLDRCGSFGPVEEGSRSHRCWWAHRCTAAEM